MRTVSYKLADLGKVVIHLGKMAENDATQVRIDAAEVFSEYPNAVPALDVINPSGEAYTVEVTLDGTVIVWDVKDSSLTAEGNGEIQLTFTQDGTKVKSSICRTKVCRSITGGGIAPDPVQDWLDHANEVLAEVEDAIPPAGTTGQVLAKKSDEDYDLEWVDQGSGGTTDYTDLTNKPQIGGVTLTGNVSLHDIGAAAESDIPDPTSIIDDNSTGASKVWSAQKSNELKSAISAMDTATASAVDKALSPKTVTNGKVTEWQFKPISGGSAVLNYVTPEEYGAVGDGVTDDSQAVQDACDAGYAVYFASNKTYFIPSTVTIDHDCRLFGGENSVIKTVKQDGQLNDVFNALGTLKKTTTITTNYTKDGKTDNSGNRFTLEDMTGINIGDLLVIGATDQYYNYSRQYYYLGGVLKIGDIYDGHLYTTISLPFDIEKTENVTVEIYDAPTVVFENLHFVGEMIDEGFYHQFILLRNCKNSVVRNCSFTRMDSGIAIRGCIDTLIDGVEVSKAKELNTRQKDSYGVQIVSATNTIIQRMNAVCGQCCVGLTGNYTNINTFIRDSTLVAECRNNAVGSHENSWNTVVEDCTLGGLNVLGTAFVSRCRFIQNNRVDYESAITFCGSHNPEYAVLKIKDCEIAGNRNIYIYSSEPQNPIQAFDNIVGHVEITNCTGGRLVFDGRTSEYILSNRIKDIRIEGWKGCREFYRVRPSLDIIEKMVVVDSEFTERYWVNDHNDAHKTVLTNIYDLDYSSSIPMQHKISVDKDAYAEKYTLPGNTPIELTSDNLSAKFVVCGKNLASNDPDDYVIGSVSGSDGGTLTRTQATGSIPTITNDADGNIVYTQLNNTSSYSIYPVGMFYIKEPVEINLYAKLKNTGETSGATFRPYIAVVDCDTGKLISRYASTAVEATTAGADISCEHIPAKANCIAMAYFYCNSPVALSETTFENMSVVIDAYFAPSSKESIPPYIAKRITGDGTILSFDGINNIMCSDLDFHVKIAADYIENPIGILPSATGVSF